MHLLRGVIRRMSVSPVSRDPSRGGGSASELPESGGKDGGRTQKADLVLEGGGVKGIGLVGAVLVLDEAGYRFQRVAGTSAGAIVAALVAALQAAGEPLSRLRDLMRSVAYPKFMNHSAFGDIGLAERLIRHQGLYDGKYLIDWLGSTLQEIGITTFSQLRDDDPGLDARLSASQRYTLVVHTADISRAKLVRLPWDYPCYGLAPDQQLIVDAVRASMSIPFFFQPVRFASQAATVDGVQYPADKITWVDGGLLSNFPVEVFDRTDGVPARWPTIGIKLSAQAAVLPPAHQRDDLIGETIDTLRTLIDNADRYYLTPDKVKRTIFVDNAGISATDFHLTPDQQERLFGNGQQAASAYVAAQTATS
jgi:NTE family protein